MALLDRVLTHVNPIRVSGLDTLRERGRVTKIPILKVPIMEIELTMPTTS